MEQYITIKDLCAKLKISPRAAATLVATPGFPKIKVGHNVKIIDSKVDPWLAERSEEKKRKRRRRYLA